MSEHARGTDNGERLRRLVEQHVTAATRGMVVNLQVITEPGRIVIHGSCWSHHVKQVALLAARAVIGEQELELALTVK